MGVDDGVRAQPPRELALLLAGRDADDTPGPEAPGQLHRQRADAPGGGVDDHALPRPQLRARAQQVPGRRALQHERQRLAVAHRVGQLPHDLRRGHRALGIAAAGQQRDDAPPVRRPAHDLPARHERQLRRREVRVLRLVGVRVVHAGGADVEQHGALGRLRLGNVTLDEHLGTAELLDLDRAHPRDPSRAGDRWRSRG
jgi:hypothetical protein